MAATASYDAREFAARIYAERPEQSTLDLLDAEDLVIARLARERYEALGGWLGWHAVPGWMRQHALANAILERHPNPRRTP